MRRAMRRRRARSVRAPEGGAASWPGRPSLDRGRADARGPAEGARRAGRCRGHKRPRRHELHDAQCRCASSRHGARNSRRWCRLCDLRTLTHTRAYAPVPLSAGRVARARGRRGTPWASCSSSTCQTDASTAASCATAILPPTARSSRRHAGAAAGDEHAGRSSTAALTAAADDSLGHGAGGGRVHATSVCRHGAQSFQGRHGRAYLFGDVYGPGRARRGALSCAAYRPVGPASTTALARRRIVC